MRREVFVHFPRSVLQEVTFRLTYRHKVADFMERHGGEAMRPTRGENSPCGTRGWSEVYAVDGYALRCEWSRTDAKEGLQFLEIAGAPTTSVGGMLIPAASSTTVIDPHGG
jgi:hypothetical protein